MQKKVKKITKQLNENRGYKIIALVVTLVLWITMGRKTVVTTKEINLEVLLPSNKVLSNTLPKSITVKVSGPRVAVNKINGRENVATLNLENIEVGRHRIELTDNAINLPVGVKILSIEPEQLRLRINEQ